MSKRMVRADGVRSEDVQCNWLCHHIDCAGWFQFSLPLSLFPSHFLSRTFFPSFSRDDCCFFFRLYHAHDNLHLINSPTDRAMWSNTKFFRMEFENWFGPDKCVLRFPMSIGSLKRFSIIKFYITIDNFIIGRGAVELLKMWNFREKKTVLIAASESQRLGWARRQKWKENSLHDHSRWCWFCCWNRFRFVQLQLCESLQKMQFCNSNRFRCSSRWNLPCEWLFLHHVVLLDFGVDEDFLEELGLRLNDPIADVQNFFWQHFS